MLETRKRTTENEKSPVRGDAGDRGGWSVGRWVLVTEWQMRLPGVGVRIVECFQNAPGQLRIQVNCPLFSAPLSADSILPEPAREMPSGVLQTSRACIEGETQSELDERADGTARCADCSHINLWFVVRPRGGLFWCCWDWSLESLERENPASGRWFPGRVRPVGDGSAMGQSHPPRLRQRVELGVAVDVSWIYEREKPLGLFLAADSSLPMPYGFLWLQWITSAVGVWPDIF